MSRKITAREKAEFCTQLSVMLQARISIQRALQALSRQVSNRKMKLVVEKLGKDIQKGNSFTKALALQPGIFDDLFIMTAEVGQESGRLAEVLRHLAQHLEKMNALRRKFFQALTYPLLVISVACFAVTFLLVFIVPTFAEMFKSFQMELPASTRIVLGISHVAVSYGMYAVAAAAVIAFLSWKSINTPSTRQRIESFAFKIPVVGDILLKNHVARFCRTLGTLLQAQVSLVDALDVTQRIISNAEMKKDIREILKQVKQGKTVAEPLVESSIFPPMVSQMIAVGEETSELDAMLLKVADYYEKDLDSKVESLSSVIEPVLILLLGLIVAAILISMYLPMFDLVNVVGGTG
ncbi:MAG TPA: type II secretion system F family protein [Bacteroidota bacterium]|jgi:type IV pilus assembly protein PilC|nr:type II secretion system F family protein [Bacteroidota bacterium]